MIDQGVASIVFRRPLFAEVRDGYEAFLLHSCVPAGTELRRNVKKEKRIEQTDASRMLCNYLRAAKIMYETCLNMA